MLLCHLEGVLHKNPRQQVFVFADKVKITCMNQQDVLVTSRNAGNKLDTTCKLLQGVYIIRALFIETQSCMQTRSTQRSSTIAAVCMNCFRKSFIAAMPCTRDVKQKRRQGTKLSTKQLSLPSPFYFAKACLAAEAIPG